MVGKFADDGAYAPVVEEVILAFAQVQRNLSTAIRFGDIGNRIPSPSPSIPTMPFLPCHRRAGAHRYFIRDDKRRVEAHAELPISWLSFA
ncbi:hypothetical protein ACNKHO_02790 [Shigella flexneri]